MVHTSFFLTNPRKIHKHSFHKQRGFLFGTPQTWEEPWVGSGVFDGVFRALVCLQEFGHPEISAGQRQRDPTLLAENLAF